MKTLNCHPSTNIHMLSMQKKKKTRTLVLTVEMEIMNFIIFTA